MPLGPGWVGRPAGGGQGWFLRETGAAAALAGAEASGGGGSTAAGVPKNA